MPDVSAHSSPSLTKSGNGHLRALFWFLAAAGNAVLLLLIALSVAENLRRNAEFAMSSSQLVLFCFMVGVPLLNLAVLLPHYGKLPITWLSLYLQRKHAEERARLHELEAAESAQRSQDRQ